MAAKEKLFFVRADNADGVNIDLLVRAETKEQAEAYWREYYELDADEVPIDTGEVPVSGPPGAINWGDILHG